MNKERFLLNMVISMGAMAFFLSMYEKEYVASNMIILSVISVLAYYIVPDKKK